MIRIAAIVVLLSACGDECYVGPAYVATHHISNGPSCPMAVSNWDGNRAVSFCPTLITAELPPFLANGELADCGLAECRKADDKLNRLSCSVRCGAELCNYFYQREGSK